ncbi:MAG: PAS domain-containing protein [Rhodoferax sp.]|nr:PAS domain-containing protein [Rhodoferax sp.]
MSTPSDSANNRKPAMAVRIVGIGASAGGLPALEQFFIHVPAKSGLAYVVVQHLDPTATALLAELLQRVTGMSVREAAAQMRVEPDCVYVIPPNTELSVARSTLQLDKPSEPRGLRLPVNVLFSSLARDQGSSAIGVVLSGMGSDGTLGLQAIKAAGGLTVVQEPSSAQFDSMPKSAIAADCGDIVAMPSDMPSRILAFAAQAPSATVPGHAQLGGRTGERADSIPPDSPAETLNRIFTLLQQRTRHDFSLYKTSTLNRRIERRMAIHGKPTMADYAHFLGQNPHEIDLLFKELLIGVTSFFRDPAVWQYLHDTALPAILARRGPQTHFRAWVAGCSTGEEAYTLAMVFVEVVQRLPEHRECTLQIFASDLSPDAVATARTGRYPAAISAQLSPESLARFFTRQADGLCIGKRIRDMVLFARHDVVLDPPFTSLDILCCRNLLIYFDAALQRRLLPLFHYSLRPGGVLMLGSSETVGTFSRLFEPIESKLRLYLRLNPVAASGPAFLVKSFPPLSKLTKEPAVSPSASQAQRVATTETLQSAADHVLLQVHAPPAVVVNSAGDVVYISGRTGKYLEPAAGKANLNFHAMVRDSLREPIAAALKQALVLDVPQRLRGLQVHPGEEPANSKHPMVEVTVQPLHEPAALKGMVMIVFRDVAPKPARRRHAAGGADTAHSVEIQQCREEIQSLGEEARASKEELQSANEELQSTNEELQSANEELTTSKEEMQSMNEELQTVNAEMQTKLDDLALAQSDLKNLLNSTDIAMLFLDQNLNVRRYTERAAKIINLRDSDIGRPLSDLTTSLAYSALQDDAHQTLRTLVFSEKQILDRDGRWFSVRIMPYRRLDNVIDGAVITFVDITATKQLESSLRQAADP